MAVSLERSEPNSYRSNSWLWIRIRQFFSLGCIDQNHSNRFFFPLVLISNVSSSMARATCASTSFLSVGGPWTVVMPVEWLQMQTQLLQRVML